MSPPLGNILGQHLGSLEDSLVSQHLPWASHRIARATARTSADSQEAARIGAEATEHHLSIRNITSAYGTSPQKSEHHLRSRNITSAYGTTRNNAENRTEHHLSCTENYEVSIWTLFLYFYFQNLLAFTCYVGWSSLFLFKILLLAFTGYVEWSLLFFFFDFVISLHCLPGWSLLFFF